MANGANIFSEIFDLEIPNVIRSNRDGRNRAFRIRFSTDGPIPHARVILHAAAGDYTISGGDIIARPLGENAVSYVASIPRGVLEAGAVQVEIAACKVAESENASSDDWVTVFRDLRVSPSTQADLAVEPSNDLDQSTPAGQAIEDSEAAFLPLAAVSTPSDQEQRPEALGRETAEVEESNPVIASPTGTVDQIEGNMMTTTNTSEQAVMNQSPEETQATEDRTPRIGQAELVVYFKRPPQWREPVYVYFSNPTPPIGEVDWPGVLMEEARLEDGEDWYVQRFFNLTAASFVFTDGQERTPELYRDRSGWYSTDNTWYDDNPDRAAANRELGQPVVEAAVDTAAIAASLPSTAAAPTNVIDAPASFSSPAETQRDDAAAPVLLSPPQSQDIAGQRSGEATPLMEGQVASDQPSAPQPAPPPPHSAPASYRRPLIPPDEIFHALVLEMHQPSGNLEHLLDTSEWEAKEILFAYDRMARFLGADTELARLARVNATFSGILLETLANPDFQRRVYGIVKCGDLLHDWQERQRQGSLEVLGTGYYHPLFALIPEADWDEQIGRGSESAGHFFPHRRPAGFWPPDLAFDMRLIPHLKRAGYRYVIVDSEYVRPLDPMSWHELRYRPHVAEYGGEEIVVVVRDRDLSKAQLAGMDYDWFYRELLDRTQDCAFPPLVTTATSGDNGGWFRNVDEEANFWGHFYRPALDAVRSGLSLMRPTFINDYLDRFGAHGRVRVERGAWNTEEHHGWDFTQWQGSEAQRRTLERVEQISAAFHNPAMPVSPENRREAQWRLLRAQASDNFFWGDAWLYKVHEDLNPAEQVIREVASPATAQDRFVSMPATASTASPFQYFGRAAAERERAESNLVVPDFEARQRELMEQRLLRARAFGDRAEALTRGSTVSESRLTEPPYRVEDRACPSCRSVLSPGAYLADLIDFVLECFSSTFGDVSALEARFHRPLQSLIQDCEAAEREVRQVAIANEVLERLILETFPTLTRDELYARLARPGENFPRPDVLNRLFDALLNGLGTSRQAFAAAFRAAYPASGTADRTLLDALLDRIRLEEPDLTTNLGLTPQDLTDLEQRQATIGLIDRLPDLIVISQTCGIDASDPMQLLAYSDAVTRAENIIDRANSFTLADIRANLIQDAFSVTTVWSRFRQHFFPFDFMDSFDPGDLQLVGDFVGLGRDQILFINRIRTFDGLAQLLVAAFDQDLSIRIVFQDGLGQSSPLQDWYDPDDVQLVGDFMGLGRDQVLFINRSGQGGRVLIADFQGGPPASVVYREDWGQFPLFDGWHDPEDLQFVGDFMGLGRDQVLFINRSGQGGRVLIADFQGGPPASVVYREDWGQFPLFDGWHDPEDLQFVGDFMGLGRDQVLFINRSGQGGRVLIADFQGGPPASVVYREDWGQFPLFDGWHDPEDLQFVGDFMGLGRDQVLFINRSGQGRREMVVDFRSGPPARVMDWAESRGVSVFNEGSLNLVGNFTDTQRFQFLSMRLEQFLSLAVSINMLSRRFRSERELGNYLQIDLSTDASVLTTRVASASQTLQSFVNAQRLGQETFSLDITQEDFDARWQWIQSYDLWHAALSVFFYPENFLFPNARRNRTPQFREFVNSLSESGPDTIMRAVDNYETAFQTQMVGFISFSAAINGRAFLFAPSGDALYWTELSINGTWSGWSRVPELAGRTMLGAVGFNGRIYLFFQSMGNVPNYLEYTWMDISRTEPKINFSAGQTPGSTAINRAIDLGGIPFFRIAFIAGPENLTVYFLGPRLNAACMNRFHSWFITIGSLQHERIDQALNIMSIGHISYRDYLLLQTETDFFIVSIDRPYSIGTQIDLSNAQRIFNGSNEIIDCSATTRGGQIVVICFTRAQNFQIAEFVYGNAPNWVVTPAILGARNVMELQGVFLAIGGTTYTLFTLLGSNVTVIAAGATTFGVISFDPTNWLMRHPISQERFFSVFRGHQRSLSYSQSDFINLILEEWYFFIPIAIATSFAVARNFREAISWLQIVYNPLWALEREIWVGFSRPGDPGADRRDSVDWLRDPFNPYTIARIRPGAYLLYTVLQFVDVLLSWADSEFSRDTGEAVNRARELYELADDILRSGDLPLNAWNEAWEALTTEVYLAAEGAEQVRLLQRHLERIRSGERQTTSVELTALRAILRRNDPFEDRVRALSQYIDQLPMAGARSPQTARISSFGISAASSTDPVSAIQALLSFARRPDLSAAPPENVVVTRGFGISDVEPASSTITDQNASALYESGSAPSPEVRLVASLGGRLAQDFCIPENPQLNVLRCRINTKLEYIRTGCNYAGLQRHLPAYPAPVDPIRLVQQGAAINLRGESIPDLPPPTYRFSYLIEFARSFALTAQQLEAQLLNSFEKAEEAQYNLLTARQDLRVMDANVALQALRIQEANNSVELARRQRERVRIESDHFAQLIRDGRSAYEQQAIEHLGTATDSLPRATFWNTFSLMVTTAGQGATTGAAAGPYGAIVGAAVGLGIGFLSSRGPAASNDAQSDSIISQARSFEANYDRQAQQWQLQKGIADQDLAIGEQGITLANDQLAIRQQEAATAQIQSEFSSMVVNFLATKFTSRDLYEWMARILANYYRAHLDFATVIAQMAQQALAFERRETIMLIASYYGEFESGRRGLLVAERLLTDINRLDQYRLTTERRRKEITKTVSLARYSPIEFQRLRSNGWMVFMSREEWFDRDFPGHYMRLIKNVSLTVIGLIPPGEGIKATLSNPGISRVMVGPPFGQLTVIQRQPESIAVSMPSNGTGLFELRFDDPVLLPFEGSGVETTWTLEMPKAANRFDYDALLDILLTINYTALEDLGYRQRVVSRLPTTVQPVMSFAFRNVFADAWYDLHNPTFLSDPSQYGFDPGQVKPPYTMEIRIQPGDFPPNEAMQRMVRLNLALWQSQYIRVPITIDFLPDRIEDAYRVEADIAWNPSDPNTAPLAITAFSHRRSASNSWEAVETRLTELRPFGRWRIQLRNDNSLDTASYPGYFSSEPPVYGQRQLDLSWLSDALLVLSYEAGISYQFAG